MRKISSFIEFEADWTIFCDNIFFIIKSWCVKLFNSKTDWIRHTTPPLVYQTAAGALKALGIFALPQKLNIYNPNNGGFGVIKETRECWERHTFPRFSADVYTATLKSPTIDPRWLCLRNQNASFPMLGSVIKNKWDIILVYFVSNYNLWTRRNWGEKPPPKINRKLHNGNNRAKHKTS